MKGFGLDMVIFELFFEIQTLRKFMISSRETSPRELNSQTAYISL